MRLLVTGGTGFVGSHTVAALLRDGHDVRVLARKAEKVPRALGALGLDPDDVEVAVGDATNPDDVDRALADVDGVVHAAAMYTLDPRQADTLMRTNVRTAELVLGGAADRDLEPIIHVSSVAALVPTDAEVVDLSTPTGDAPYPYHRSKARSERVARHLQDDGVPLTITNPSAVFGPHDPYVGVSSQVLLEGLKQGFTLVVPGGSMNVVDVRDVAEVHAAIVRGSNGGQARYICNAAHFGYDELWNLVAELTGRRIRQVPAPAGVAQPIARMSDWMREKLGAPHLAPAEGLFSLLITRPADAGPTEERLGLSFRPARETLVDNIRWLVEAGHLDATKAGDLAP